MEAETALQAPALGLPVQQQQLPGLQPARRASRSICSPPEGPFSYDSPDLLWEEGTYASTRFHCVSVSATRIQDFVLGENARGQTSFCVFKSERPWKPEQASHQPICVASAAIRGPFWCPWNASRCRISPFALQGLPSRTSVLSKVTYWCRVCVLGHHRMICTQYRMHPLMCHIPSAPQWPLLQPCSCACAALPTSYLPASSHEIAQMHTHAHAQNQDIGWQK